MKINTNSYDTLLARLYELLQKEQYSESTLKDMKFILDALSAYMHTHHIQDYSPPTGEKFITHCTHVLHVCASRIERATNIVGKLNRMQQGLSGRNALLPDRRNRFYLPDGLAIPLREYLAYCAENGNQKSTITYKDWICNRFLKNLLDLGCTEIKQLDGKNVQTAFLALGSIRYWERIAPFLKFLADYGYLKQNYSVLIRRPRHPMPQPTVYSPDEICAIENSFDMQTPAGVRNHAVTLLMSRYGIRACDVASLTFENIDFKNNRLHFIQRKTNDLWEGKLLPEVKKSLIRYIDFVRPPTANSANIFIKLHPPYAPLDNRAINTMIVTQFTRTQLDILGRKHGSRSFRSSVASNMINDGISTEVVRRTLGHSTKYALKHYAKIDIESMRLCPLPVPPPTGLFAEILSGKAGHTNV